MPQINGKRQVGAKSATTRGELGKGKASAKLVEDEV